MTVFMMFSSCVLSISLSSLSPLHIDLDNPFESTGFTILQALLQTIVQLKRLSLTAGIAQLEESVECSKQVYVAQVSSLY